MGGRRYIRGVAPSPSGADPGDAASAGPATEGSGDDPGSAAEDPAPPPDDPSPPPDDGTWDADVVLSDGGTMRVRPIGPDDSALIAAFHERQSPESIYFRYFSPRPRLTGADLERLTQVDRVDRMAFVGIVNGELVGVARYDRHPTRAEAEVAFFTDDAHAGRGVATILLEYLAAWARQVGITGFVAQVLPSNRRMIGVFRQAGFTVESRFADAVRFVYNVLMGTPSIIVGVFVYTILVVEPLGLGTFSGYAGAVALAVIMLPVVARTTEDMLALVPNALRESALALGAPRWKVTVGVVFRAAKTGLVTGCLLAIARVSGETAPLLFTALNSSFEFSLAGLGEPTPNLTVTIWNYAMSPFEDLQRMAWGASLLITLGVLLIMLFARFLVRERKART